MKKYSTCLQFYIFDDYKSYSIIPYVFEPSTSELNKTGLNIGRTAAQLLQLGEQTGLKTLAPILGEQPVAIAKRVMTEAAQEGFDVVILDTAGRQHLDNELMLHQ